MNTTKKLMTLLVVMTLSGFMATAQEGDLPANNRRWSLEVGATLDFLQDKLPQFHHNKQGWGLYLETRCRIGQSPFDVGLYASLSNAPRVQHYDINGEVLDENGDPIGTVTGWAENEITFAAYNVLATFDYNHRLGRRCEAFVGAGIGICKYKEGKECRLDEDPFSFAYDPHDGTSLSVMPRVGVLLFNHLRLTAGYKFQERGNRHAFVSAGIVGFFGHK